MPGGPDRPQADAHRSLGSEGLRVQRLRLPHRGNRCNDFPRKRRDDVGKPKAGKLSSRYALDGANILVIRGNTKGKVGRTAGPVTTQCIGEVPNQLDEYGSRRAKSVERLRSLLMFLCLPGEPAVPFCVLPFMDASLLNIKFCRIGARLKVADHPARRSRTAGVISLDVRADRKGEFFEFARQPGAEAEVAVLDVQPAERHLLLLVRQGKEKSKFLCGHDERHWFVAGIPEAVPVGTVHQAKEALKPAEVHSAQARKRLKARARSRRKNAAYVRQGEWFFLPVAHLAVGEKLVLRNEPLSRGNGGKPHWAEFCYRTGGETVWVSSRYPNGISEFEYRRLWRTDKTSHGWGWRVMRRDASVYVRGRIRHPDHATITLQGWHRVLMNTESQSRAMRNVAFLD